MLVYQVQLREFKLRSVRIFRLHFISYQESPCKDLVISELVLAPDYREIVEDLLEVQKFIELRIPPYSHPIHSQNLQLNHDHLLDQELCSKYYWSSFRQKSFVQI